MRTIIVGLSVIVLWLTCVISWITAIVHCVKNDMIAMLIVDIAFPPVGAIHGFIIWIGG